MRGKLGFNGAIFSDTQRHLSMEAARAGGTLTQAATAALTAGCDMVLICNQSDEAEEGAGAAYVRADEGIADPLAADAATRPRVEQAGKLMEQMEYQQARALVKSALG